MDLQGQPIPGGNTGTKVTTDPRSYQNPIDEPSGPVTNDSLAAESARSGGSYSVNRGAEPLGVSGHQSTFANTDTSGATKLPSASDSTSRFDDSRQDKYPDNLGGQGNFPGAHVPETGYVGGSTQAKREMGIDAKEYAASQKVTQSAAGDAGYRSQYNAGEAPSYVNPVVSNVGDTQPKGNNLAQGGFDSNPNNNASFTSDIGTQQDPGRASEGHFQRKNQGSEALNTLPADKQKGLDSQTWYQPLERDQRA